MEYSQCPTPLIGFCAFSGTGKTTLLEQLIPYLRSQSIKLAVIKHAHHNFDVDQSGKDSYKLRHAGATQMLISSSKRWALMNELDEDEQEWTLPLLLDQINHSALDLILVEGFKKEPLQKIELHRPSLGHSLMCLEDKHVIAVATDDENVASECNLPVLNLNDIESIGRYIINYFKL